MTAQAQLELRLAEINAADALKTPQAVWMLERGFVLKISKLKLHSGPVTRIRWGFPVKGGKVRFNPL